MWRRLFRSSSTSAAQEMEAWARRPCEVIQNAHVGTFESQELRAQYGTDAVFDDPCGTIPTPAGIVAGFEVVRFVFDVDARHEEWTFHPPLAKGMAFSEDALGGDGDVLPAQARCEQRALYTFRHAPLVKFTLPSTIVLTFDPETKLVDRHEDRWFGRPVTLNGAHALFKRLHGAAFVALFAEKGR